MAAIIVAEGDADYAALAALHAAQGGQTVYRRTDDTLWKAYDRPYRYIQLDPDEVNSFNIKHPNYGKWRYLGETMLEADQDPFEWEG